MHQPVLDEVPDKVLRQVPGANDMLKDQEYASVAQWIQRKEVEDPDGITATSEDDHRPPKLNLLGTLASMRPNLGGSTAAAHKEAACLIVKAFYDAGLINMRLGRDGGTAFLKAAACGNMEIAALLLEYGAGIPLWLITLWAPYPELVSPREGMHF